MCGLAGFLSRSNSDHIGPIISRMAATIAHRGPDDNGIWIDADAGIALGHQRLSVLDISPAGRQPMVSHCGRWVIAYNGEIYNHMELRHMLESQGSSPPWRGHSDTETLLEAVAIWGVDAALRLSVGMFAMALWDRNERALWLARDRMGEKPLYYGWHKGTFLFGSELKAIEAHPDFCGDVDRGALVLYLRHNYVPAPYSIWQGIYKLPPATWLRIQLGDTNIEPVAYWSLTEVAERGMRNPFSGTEDGAAEGLERSLGKAVQNQMLSDVPLGSLLSGGLDSSAITALMQSHSSQPIRTFTIGFEDSAYDESKYAQAVARHLGTDHTSLTLSADDALTLIPKMPDVYDEPFSDSSQLPTHLVMKLARQHVKVVLSGDGGDEMLGGYNRYFRIPQIIKWVGWMPKPLKNHLSRAFDVFSSEKLHKLGRGLPYASSIDDMYVALVSEWRHPERGVFNGYMPSNLLNDRSRWPCLPDAVARMMALDALTYLPDDILVKIDRAAMAVSLETRTPFLDPSVVEFAWSLPMNMKIAQGRGKLVLRKLLDRYIPSKLIDRPKSGFEIPLNNWLRGPLRDWAESLLSYERLEEEGYFKPDIIRDIWWRHLKQKSSFGYHLWPVLMFQAWLESRRSI